ncbi:kinesin-like protein [Kipferlia bialata]|uniref:Kinesin-like protein n=1 Tax=Kipferlia bialata TaxID=797122 RepID=A0A9K3CVD7_9EUKA|nr:kinesin-like protein [Kipferlia bialata]|eukprot:g4426.t1
MQAGDTSAVTYETGSDSGEVCTVSVSDGMLNGETRSYGCDTVFGPDSTNAHVMERCGVPLVNRALEGYGTSLLAYGQTGAGKTHTVLGHSAHSMRAHTHINTHIEGDKGDSPHSIEGDSPVGDTGLVYRVCAHLFRCLSHPDYSGVTVSVSFLEVYNEVVRDLLPSTPSPTGREGERERERDGRAGERGRGRGRGRERERQKVSLRDRLQGGIEREREQEREREKARRVGTQGLKVITDTHGAVSVIGLSHVPVYCTDDVERLVTLGHSHRVTAQTAANAVSSRSHAVLRLSLSSGGSIVLADLAGSEYSTGRPGWQ